jgi:beta-mannosidase
MKNMRGMNRQLSLRSFLCFSFALALAWNTGYSSRGFAETAVEHLSLNGDWQFRQISGDPHAGTADWHAAVVPGVVQTDLLASELIPAPFYGENEAQLQWIGFAGWEYQRTFAVSEQQLRQKHADLVFYGLDTFAKVFVNGQPVLSADNMFRTWRIDIRPQLRAGSNTIRVEFASPILSVLPQVKTEKYRLPGGRGSSADGVATSSYVRKASYNYGWDWAPCFVTEGIWRPVEIEFWDTAHIDNVYVHQLDVRKESANLSIETDIVASAPARVSVDLDDSRWTPPADSGADAGRPAKGLARAKGLHQTVWLHSGMNHVVFPLNLDHPALWYPAGYGEQSMYRFGVELRDGKHLLDSKEAHTGLRSVELQRKHDQWGISFTFVVNGIPIFAKGANLIPFDSFPTRVTDAQMRRVLQSAVDCNMNMLRVWGGGYYETDRFYEMADQLGLMLWQEFMSGDLYAYNKSYLDNIHQEAIDQVRRLRDHPSIILWCGNNEIEVAWDSYPYMAPFKSKLPPDVRDTVWGGYMHLYSGVLPQVIARYSPGTPYWPSSPSNDYVAPLVDNNQYGDAHYEPEWDGQVPFSAYDDQYPRFMSEFAIQSFPAMATIDTFTEPQDRTLFSPEMLAHQKSRNGNQNMQMSISSLFPQPRDFPSFVYVSQVLQAENIKFGAEHLRRNRPHVMGALYWQLNDCWPVVSWSSVDYYGRWKALQYYARRFYQDVLVSPHLRDGNVEVAVVSDRLQPLRGTMRLQLMDFSGSILSKNDVPVEIAPLSATQVWATPQKDYLQAASSTGDSKFANPNGADPSQVFLHAELLISGENDGQAVSTNNLYFLPFKELHLPRASIKATWLMVDGKPALHLSSAVLARDVDVDSGNLDAQPSDNFFDLLPGRSRTITFQTTVPAGTLEKEVHVMSLTDAFAAE